MMCLPVTVADYSTTIYLAAHVLHLTVIVLLTEDEGDSPSKKMAMSVMVDPTMLSSHVLFGNDELPTELDK
jgi:hypothetical protein